MSEDIGIPSRRGPTARATFACMSTPFDPATRITDIDGLETVYGKPMPRALAKELDHLNEHYVQLIRASPFVTVATSGPKGLCVSPSPASQYNPSRCPGRLAMRWAYSST